MTGKRARVRIPPVTMTVKFYHFIPDKGISAFKDDSILMSLGSPVIETFLTIAELQKHLQTLEQAIDDEPSYGQRIGLQSIHDMLSYALKKHQEQHAEFIEEAPTGADLEEYMLSYANAIKGGAI
jgi:hypothetical protein